MSAYETADGGTNLRYTSAGRSLAAWYRRQCHEIGIARNTARRLVESGEATPAVADEFLAEVDEKERSLHEGWRNSSLRAAIESRAVTDDDGGTEHRVALAGRAGAVTYEPRASIQRTAQTIHGYASVCNVWTEIGGMFKERVAPGAFAECLTKSDCRCLLNHDHNHIFGRQSAGTLRLREDSHGLRFECDLLEFDGPSYGLARRIERRDLQGCSFAFTVADDSWRLARQPGELDERTILSIDTLYDVGPVCFPAYEQTSVHATFVDVTRSAPDQSAADVYDYDEEEHDIFIRDYERTQRLAAAEERLRSRRLDEMLARTRGTRLAAATNRNREGRLRAYETRFSLCGRR
ncbi:MAG: HK97 family phage prohead protease [Planctomycetota bacterium]|jgi:HK97 family phage prohead protease|nr:HK97 family phage prohead protease [Planctomycetota bacterium]